MRTALLTLLLLLPSALAATSYRAWSPFGTFEVDDRRFVYVQISELRRYEVPPPGFQWKKSGLYRSGNTQDPVWEGNLDLQFYDRLFVADDGHAAGVLHLAHDPCVRFYRDGQLYRTWELPSPPKRRVSETDVGSGIHSWWNWYSYDGFLAVRNRVGDEFTFRIGAGELHRRTYAQRVTPSDEEMAAFALALAEGDEVAPSEGSTPSDGAEAWISEIPNGAAVFVSPDGAVRIVQIPATAPPGPQTRAYNKKGSELWRVNELLEQPFFLREGVEQRLVSIETPGGGNVPLLVSEDGTAWAKIEYRKDSRQTSVRLSRGSPTLHDVASTYAGNLKFGGVWVFAMGANKFAIDLVYGLEWSERYVFDMSDGSVAHSTAFPESSPDDDRPSRSYGAGGGWWLIAGVALVLLLVGFAVGRLTKRR